jgi:hypothetical protein
VTVYSTRFYGGRPATSPLALYSVPAGYVAVVRSVQMLVTTSGLTLSVSSSATGASIAWALSAAPIQYFNFDVRAVVQAGETINAGGGNGSHQLYISGYLLST